METIKTDLDALAETITAFVPKLNETEQHVAIGLYRLLSQGKPVSISNLVQTTECPSDAVHHSLSTWPGVYFDDNKNVIGFWGLALPETIQIRRFYREDL